VLLYETAVDVRTVSGIQILEERIIENIDNQRVMTADGRIVDAHVIIREPADRVALLGHVVLCEYLLIQA
jgi:ribosome-interacting GTPase 1